MVRKNERMNIQAGFKGPIRRLVDMSFIYGYQQIVNMHSMWHNVIMPVHQASVDAKRHK